MGRGAVTKEVKELANKYDLEITIGELRLMPYIHYRLINHGNLALHLFN